MAKQTKTIFVCQNCGAGSIRWVGRCPDCNSWNSMIEEKQVPVSRSKRPLSIAQQLCSIPFEEGQRISSGMDELDRVLGGGIVSGSVILIGGEPGIGKSTLLLQVSNFISSQGLNVLYVTGEESVKQTRLRAERLGSLSKNLYVLAETELEQIIENLRTTKPCIVIIDSIQVIFREDIASAPGSVSQVRECAYSLVSYAKTEGTPIFLVGHVTKDGTLAGPRVLEHIVDTVIYFEGERQTSFRIIRAIKNRFGSTNEIGVFELTNKGLEQVKNPSEILLSQRPEDTVGSAVSSVIEGTRPLLVEIQALVSPTYLGIPRRRVVGLDYNRFLTLTAVLERRCNISIGSSDVYGSVAGGVKAEETGVDLAIAMSVASSHLSKPLPKDAMWIGEIGLAGELRAVSQIEIRLREAERMGFKKCWAPKQKIREQQRPWGLKIEFIKTVSEAIKNITGL